MTDKLLDIDNDETVRLSVSEAQELGEQALLKLGFTPEEASIVTTHLVDASMWGYEFAGLPRILVIAERPELKKPRTFGVNCERDCRFGAAGWRQQCRLYRAVTRC